MPFNFPCPKCGRVILNVPESYAGQRGRCLNCKNLVNIPTLLVNEIHEPVPAGHIPAGHASPPAHRSNALSVAGNPSSRSQHGPFTPLPSIPKPVSSGYNPEYSPSSPQPVYPQVLEQSEDDEDIPPPLVETGRAAARKPQQRALLATRRYPFLRRYCSILTTLTLIIGGATILTGVGIAVSPLFWFNQPFANAALILMAVAGGLAVSLGGYASLVFGLAGVELLHVVMDIEQNTRKLTGDHPPSAGEGS